MLESFYHHLVAGDGASIVSLFDGFIAIDSPRSGAVSGVQALHTYLAEEGGWLRGCQARFDLAATAEDERRKAVELVAWLQIDGQTIDLPIAIIGQKSGSGYGQIRIYHSTWPLTGRHIARPPIVWPGPHEAEAPIVRRYFEALEQGDGRTLNSLFSPDGYVREPSGSRYRHQGSEGRAQFYAAVTAQPGGVGLVHASHTTQGRLSAVEYVCEQWGRMRFAPMCGCAFYELDTAGNRITAVRIYDDVTPPAEDSAGTT